MFLKFCEFDIRENVFVYVSCIIKCDKSFLFNEFCKNKKRNHISVNCTLFYIRPKVFISF